MNISRRFFIGGAASFGAFGGCRFLSCHDYRAGGTPNLRFGVVSDIHITDSDPLGKDAIYGSNATFRKTLQWFRDQNVDAVMIAGDMADKGMDTHLEAVAEAWYSVFPGDRYPDGRPIEKVFVYGNHDHYGFSYGGFAKKLYPDENERIKHILRADLKGWWQKIFHEPYSRFYAKEIKGYTFLGGHWDNGTGINGSGGWGEDFFGPPLKAWLDAHARSLDPTLPFFYVQHPHPKDTCYGPWAWGHDKGGVTAALSPYANAIAFSGHSHYSLTDERSLWQGAFTSVGTSSLRYCDLPYNEYLPVGYENTSTEGKDAFRYNAQKLMRCFPANDCRQGMLWTVYDDCIVIKRREFLSDTDVGDDWVMPLPAAESRPFAFAERAKSFAAPEFVPNATVKVEKVETKTRGGKSKDGKTVIPSETKTAYRVTAPAVLQTKKSRLYDLVFVAESKTGEKKTKLVMAEGYNHALGHPRTKLSNFCLFALDELPKGDIRFTVTPRNCFARSGHSLSSNLQPSTSNL